MKIRVGIVGLPNVGKSTLFNALARTSLAQAANFPFCTIEPNTAPIAVPDEHLERLAAFSGHERAVSATMDWVDIAGLAKGASRGEGLGNKFLANIRECDAILHVVRTFEDVDTIHVDGQVEPTSDAEAINIELMLADLAHVERRLEKTTCKGEERTCLETVAASLSAGVPARSAGLSGPERRAIKAMGLLTLKPVLYCFNVDETDFLLGDHEELSQRAAGYMEEIDYVDRDRDRFAFVSARVEAEVSSKQTEGEQIEYLVDMGLEEEQSRELLSGRLSYQVLPRMVCSMLGLSLAYTGPGVPPERSKTTRAHLHRTGSMTALGMAGRIHGELQRGFIKAEVAHASTLLQHATHWAAKEAGVIRTEGKDYQVADGDVVLIKWST